MGAEPPVHEGARLVLLTRTKIKARLHGGKIFTFADQFLLEVGSGCRCEGVPISCKMRVRIQTRVNTVAGLCNEDRAIIVQLACVNNHV